MKERLLATKTQGTNEAIAYEVDFTKWGTVASVTSVTVSPTATLTGSPALLGNVVTTPKLSGLSDAVLYSLMIIVVIAGNTMSGVIQIRGEA